MDPTISSTNADLLSRRLLTSPEMCCCFDLLPDEMMHEILGHATPSSAALFLRTSKNYYKKPPLKKFYRSRDGIIGEIVQEDCSVEDISKIMDDIFTGEKWRVDEWHCFKAADGGHMETLNFLLEGQCKHLRFRFPYADLEPPCNIYFDNQNRRHNYFDFAETLKLIWLSQGIEYSPPTHSIVCITSAPRVRNFHHYFNAALNSGQIGPIQLSSHTIHSSFSPHGKT